VNGPAACLWVGLVEVAASACRFLDWIDYIVDVTTDGCRASKQHTGLRNNIRALNRIDDEYEYGQALRFLRDCATTSDI
jgi:hypothetical protein